MARIDGKQLESLINVTASRAVTASFAENAEVGGLWTGSAGIITRKSNVQITGSLNVSESLFVENVNVSSSIASLEIDSGSFSIRVTNEESTSSLLTATASNHGIRISDLETDSSSFESRITTNETDIDNLQTDSASFESRIAQITSSLWTASNGGITRDSDVEITGEIKVGQSLTDIHRFTGSIEQTGSGTTNIFSDNVQITGSLFVRDSASFGFTNIDSASIGSVTAEVNTSSLSITNNLEVGQSSTFGSSSANKHDFTGSVDMTGSLLINQTDVSSSIATNEIDIDNLQTDSASFESRITTNETDISDLQSDSGSFESRITLNEATASNLVADSASFSTRVSTNETDISDLQSDSASFEDRITLNENTGSNLVADSSSFESRITLNENTGSNLVADSGSFETRITDVEDNFTNDSASWAITSSFAITASFAENAGGGGSSLWTASNGAITRESDVQVTGSVRATETGSFTIIEADADTIITEDLEVNNELTASELSVTGTASFDNLIQGTSSFAITASFAENAGGAEGLWTQSNNTSYIERESEVRITGSLLVNPVTIGQGIKLVSGETDSSPALLFVTESQSTSKVAHASRDGHHSTLASASDLVIANNSGSVLIGATNDADNIKFYTGTTQTQRVKINNSGNTEISGNLDITGTYFGDGSGLTNVGGGLWTASAGYIERQSDVQITGSLFVGESSGDTVVTIASDPDNTNESWTPRIEFYEDGNLVKGKIGLSEGVNSEYYNAKTNSLFLINEWSNGFIGSVQLGVENTASISLRDPSNTEITGNLWLSGTMFGTASQAITASFAENAGGGGSVWSDSGSYIAVTNEVQITGSLNITGSLDVTETGSFDYMEVQGDTIVTTDIEVAESGSFSYIQASSSDVSGTGSFGYITKGGGSFAIAHPDPSKTDTHTLWHSFVESPTEGDNIYRWTIQADKDYDTIYLDLPDYWKYLNKNPQVWVSPVNQFAHSYGKVNEDLTQLIIRCEKSGKYNVLLIGTRKDDIAEGYWKGVEREK